MNLTSDQVELLIQQAEGETLEFKAVLPPSKTIAQLVASFSNTQGGHIILGVIDKAGGNQIKGLSSDFHALGITHKALDLLTPRPNVDFNYVKVDSKQLFYIAVEKSDHPILLEGKLYVRKGTISILEEEPTPVPSSPEQTGFGKLNDLFTMFTQFKEESTGSKAKFLEHYMSMLKIFKDLGSILYPDSPDVVTSNLEGKILSRILFSSAMDNFETYLSDILYEIFLAKPETLKSEQQMTIKEVLSCSDLQEFVHYWAKQKIGKLQKGSVAGFIKENQQIKDLGAISLPDQAELEKFLQIRHLYSHRNGVVDEKFLRYYNEGNALNTEHRMPIKDICDKLEYVATVVDKIDKAAIAKYSLST